MCVAPSGRTDAVLTTSMRGQTVHELRIAPDAVEHPLTEAECRGTQRAEWSASGLRLFSTATLTCGTDTSTRQVSGISLLTGDGSWLDVQSVSVSGRESVRVRRYRRVADATPRRLAGAAVSLADLKEASGKVSPATIEAALVEGSTGFPLSAKDLRDLKDARVATSVIDVLVALSYPDRFVVDRGVRDVAYGVPGGALYDPFFMGWAFGDPFLFNNAGYYSSVYGAFSPYYYDAFSYRTFGPAVIVASPGFDGGGIGGGNGGGPESSGNGRVVNGRGYTQVRPRGTTPDTPSQAARTDRSGGSNGSSSSASSSSSSSSGGGSVSPQGASSGGGDSGRTAQPR